MLCHLLLLVAISFLFFPITVYQKSNVAKSRGTFTTVIHATWTLGVKRYLKCKIRHIYAVDIIRSVSIQNKGCVLNSDTSMLPFQWVFPRSVVSSDNPRWRKQQIQLGSLCFVALILIHGEHVLQVDIIPFRRKMNQV